MNEKWERVVLETAERLHSRFPQRDLTELQEAARRAAEYVWGVKYLGYELRSGVKP